ncbi:MAG: hypothetical protein MHM6MM_003880 [Cercozoa sp. M6MM]
MEDIRAWTTSLAQANTEDGISNVVFAEYIWLDAEQTVRGKSRVLTSAEHCNAVMQRNVKALPEWNFDGSSTEQASGHDSEVLLRPVAMYDDPFRKRPHVLVLCETRQSHKYDWGAPHASNTRAECLQVMQLASDSKPWFGLEQEFTLLDGKTMRPLGWPANPSCTPAPQGPYYCSVGANKAIGREISEAHAQACVYAGLKLSGTNAEVMPSQWEFQIGPCEGITAGDQVTVARYLLHRVAEMADVVATIHPKPMPGDWNGAGCHVNFSTEAMRRDGGLSVIGDAIDRLSRQHAAFLALSGTDNDLRLTGKHETSDPDVFRHGVGDRGAAVRIPNATHAQVTRAIVQIAVLQQDL